MTELIAFQTYRTERLLFNEESFTVQFTKRNDGEEYALLAVNDTGTKSWRGFYSAETAADFERAIGQQLQDEAYTVLKGDIERGLVQ